MCLIITGSAHDIRSTLINTVNLLDDIFTSNPDGVGVMYATSKHGLRVRKALPGTYIECRNFVSGLPDDARNLAIHFRQRTHGDTDLENCHPYMVKPGLAMMHNGILAHGNAADTTKSDTWHYIHNYIAPLEEKYPGITTDLHFQCVVENDIGNNRFVFLDEEGEMYTYNAEQGIECGSLWFSNTYAWSPELLIPGYKRYTPPTYAGGRSGWSDMHGQPWVAPGAVAGTGAEYEDDDDEAFPYDLGAWADDLWACVTSLDDEGLVSLLEDEPTVSLDLLFEHDQFVVSPEYAPAANLLGSSAAHLVELLEAEDVSALAREIRSGRRGAEEVAEAICFYGSWEGKPLTNKTPLALTAEEVAEVYLH